MIFEGPKPDFWNTLHAKSLFFRFCYLTDFFVFFSIFSAMLASRNIHKNRSNIYQKMHQNIDEFRTNVGTLFVANVIDVLSSKEALTPGQVQPALHVLPLSYFKREAINGDLWSILEQV